MRKTDIPDVLAGVAAVVCDAGAVVGGFLLAVWIRFDSGWLPLRFDAPAEPYAHYFTVALVAALLYVLVFLSLGLYTRPQVGSFVNKIPRLVRGGMAGTLLMAVLAFAVQNEVAIARLVIGLSLFTVVFFVLLERYVAFRIEWNVSRHSRVTNRVLILGTDDVAAHLQRTLRKEPMLRSRAVAFLRTDGSEPSPAIRPDMIRGTVEELERFLADNPVDQVILSSADLGRARTLEIVMLCERNLVTFNMVPDLFRIMTSSMDVQTLDDIPLLGVSRWPLDLFWNRALKRIADIIGSLAGLVLAVPVLVAAAIVIKRGSPGPIFFSQERCGRAGRPFTLYKLRTMRTDAESESGPVFAAENDPRTTPSGAFMRRCNLDELPQLWNVLKGEMSLVGPRPERPHFVEKFKEGIGRYMWRHVSKPGMTGWAQVNGLRGNTSIEERVKYDLYYLENWSLALDFKILLKTLIARENAY